MIVRNIIISTIKGTRSHIRYSHSFSFSGCGWLTSFHLGVIDVMKKNGYITDKSIFGGTSGGSIGALIACLDVDPKEAANILISLSTKKDFKRNVDIELKLVIKSLLPDNTLERCNGRLHITLTEASLTLPGRIVSKYENVNQLVDIVGASCFIPVYSARRLATSVTGLNGFYIDGGVRAFMPPIGDIRVTPFPVTGIRSYLERYRNTHITLPVNSYTIPQLLLWSLFPPSPEKLTKLFVQGQQAAQMYVDTIEHHTNKNSADANHPSHSLKQHNFPQYSN